MKMYKEEGNDLFKEKKYEDAGEYYTQAIFLACTIERLEGRAIETELVSSVFCNRAACLHKLVRDTIFLLSWFSKKITCTEVRFPDTN